jgi:hypothetical protein
VVLKGGTHMNNSLMVINPYWHKNTWVFDDEAVGLKQEPFVLNVPEMIDDLVKGIPGAKKGFKLIFSASPFPTYQVELEWVREDSGGNWYRIKGQTQEGWLCPALFKYFEEAPKYIFAKAEPIKRGLFSI